VSLSNHGAVGYEESSTKGCHGEPVEPRCGGQLEIKL